MIWLPTSDFAVSFFSVVNYLDVLEKAVRVSWIYLSSELGVDHLTAVKVHASSSYLKYRHMPEI